MTLDVLLDFVKRTRGFDFTGYKRSTIERRVAKRMGELKVASYDDYLDHKAAIQSAGASTKPQKRPDAPKSNPPKRGQAEERVSRVSADGGSAGAISGPSQLKGLKKETVEGRRKDRTLERDIRSIKTRLAAVEAQIHELEVRLEDIGLSLADPDLYRDGQRARDIAQARRDTEERVAWLMKEWEDLSVRLSEASGEPR